MRPYGYPVQSLAIGAVRMVAIFGLVLAAVGCGSLPRHGGVDAAPRGLFQAWGTGGRSDVARRPAGEFYVPARAGVSRVGFSWPLKEGRVSSFYGPRGGGFHDGVDLGAPKGTPVYAARAGKVIYSGRGIRGYGNVVIVKHNEIYSTIYAHNAKNLVRHGAYVRQGEKIALVGATGRATGPHLHFEVRRNERPYDPFFVLPRGGDATSTRGLASNRR